MKNSSKQSPKCCNPWHDSVRRKQQWGTRPIQEWMKKKLLSLPEKGFLCEACRPMIRRNDVLDAGNDAADMDALGAYRRDKSTVSVGTNTEPMTRDSEEVKRSRSRSFRAMDNATPKETIEQLEMGDMFLGSASDYVRMWIPKNCVSHYFLIDTKDLSKLPNPLRNSTKNVQEPAELQFCKSQEYVT